jgi:hypothetical protein
MLGLLMRSELPKPSDEEHLDSLQPAIEDLSIRTATRIQGTVLIDVNS